VIEFVDSTTQQQLSVTGICLTLTVALCLLLLLIRPGRNLYRDAEQMLSRLAERRTRAAGVLFFSVIATRLLLLPLLPVPVPGIHDEYSYLLLADTFAHGRLTNPPHPMWVSFETFHVNWLPTYSSMFPPAQGFILALGQWLGHPWIGVLLSDAAMCVAIFWMLQAWMPARWAFLGAAIVALKFGVSSYWMNSYWGGAVAATGGALVLGALARIVKHATVGDALVAGLGLAMLANSRPYEGLFFCLPGAVWFIWWSAGRTKSRDPLRARVRNALVPLVLVLTLAGAFIAYYNWRLTGDARLMPHELNAHTYYTIPRFLWQQPKAELRYRNMAFQVFFNGWARENYHTNWADARRVSKEKIGRYLTTFFWPGAQLILPALPFLFVDRKMRLLAVTLGIGAVSVFAVVWSNPHYAAPLTCVFCALLVQAIRHLRTMRVSTMRFGIALSRAAFLLLILDTANHAVYGVCDPLLKDEAPLSARYFPCAGNRDRALMSEKLEHLSGKHLIVVRYATLHNPHNEWVFNGADIDSAKVVWARELDAQQNAKLLAYFKDRQVWLVEPDANPAEIKPYTIPDDAPDRLLRGEAPSSAGTQSANGGRIEN
jgi:hypothetical protein